MFPDIYSEQITTGDEVIIFYVNKKGPFQIKAESVTVVKPPSGAGDLWQFRRGSGTVFALNPYCPTFERMERASAAAGTATAAETEE